MSKACKFFVFFIHALFLELFYICHAGSFLAYNDFLIGEDLMTMYKAYTHFLYAMDERCFLVNHSPLTFMQHFFLIAISLIKVINVIVVLIANYAKTNHLSINQVRFVFVFHPQHQGNYKNCNIQRSSGHQSKYYMRFIGCSYVVLQQHYPRIGKFFSAHRQACP